MYIQCACTSAWKLAPQGLIPFTMLYIYIYVYIYIYIFFKIKHLKLRNIYMNLEILKQKKGERENF